VKMSSSSGRPASARRTRRSVSRSRGAEWPLRLLRHAGRFDCLARGGAGRGPVARPPEGAHASALLVVDEIGYLPISRTGAMLLFQLMTAATSTPRPCRRPTRASKRGRGLRRQRDGGGAEPVAPPQIESPQALDASQ
jgi:hypothetical protein